MYIDLDLVEDEVDSMKRYAKAIQENIEKIKAANNINTATKKGNALENAVLWLQRYP